MRTKKIISVVMLYIFIVLLLPMGFIANIVNAEELGGTVFNASNTAVINKYGILCSV